MEFLCLRYTKLSIIFFLLQKKELFKEKQDGALNKTRKEGFLTALATVIKKDPATSKRKLANELKDDEKRTNCEDSN